MRNTFSIFRVPFSFMCFPLDLDIMEKEEKIFFGNGFLGQKNKRKTEKYYEKKSISLYVTVPDIN